MTKDQLRTLIEHAADWPEEARAELLRTMVQIEAKYGGICHVDDDKRDALEQIQKLTDTHIGKIDELSKSKETEIMSV